jgi:hypothetical protein
VDYPGSTAHTPTSSWPGQRQTTDERESRVRVGPALLVSSWRFERTPSANGPRAGPNAEVPVLTQVGPDAACASIRAGE